MYCKKCGNELNENAVFCDKCGEKIEAEKSDVVVSSEIKNKKHKSNKFVTGAILNIAAAAVFTIILLALLTNVFRGNNADAPEPTPTPKPDWTITVKINPSESTEPQGPLFNVKMALVYCVIIYVLAITSALLLKKNKRDIKKVNAGLVALSIVNLGLSMTVFLNLLVCFFFWFPIILSALQTIGSIQMLIGDRQNEV